MSVTKNPVQEKSYQLAINTVKLCRMLEKEHKEFVLSRQLLRSGTAVGALVRESQNAESKKDFIHKLAIAQKECDESIYWIDLMNDTDLLAKEIASSYKEDATEVLKLLKSIIISTKKNL